MLVNCFLKKGLVVVIILLCIGTCSEIKKFVNISEYAHMDLILGDTANIKVFPEITDWLDSIT